MTAGSMGMAVEVDPQLTMPVRPRFLAELVTVPLEDGLLIDGSDEQQVLRGPAVKNLLPKLLPLLDGTRRVEQIAAELPELPHRAIHNALALLYTRGLLEDHEADPTELGAVDPQLIGFLRRYVDATRVNRSGLQALHRLAAAHAAVSVTGQHTAKVTTHLEELLKKAGVGRVSQVALGTKLRDVFTDAANGGSRLLVVLTDGHEDNTQLEQMDDQCAAMGVPWLRASVNTGSLTADLGPFFERGETACYRCFAAADAGPASVVIEPETSCAEEDEGLITRVWADMLAAEAIYVLSRIAPMSGRGVVSRYDLRTWNAERLAVSRMPGCNACRGPQAGDQAGIAPTALAYEEAVGFPSRHLLDPKSHQVHYHEHCLELANQSKQYPSAERISLPAPTELPFPMCDALRCLMSETGAATEVLNLARLSSLLMFAGGLDRQAKLPYKKLRRWAPTGGNLGSVELYVAARSVAGLTPGIYFYQACDHTLVRIAPAMNASDIAEFMGRAAPGGDSAAALVIFAAAHHRVAQKYGSFAYRVVQLDAGVALAQMKATAKGLGLLATVAPKWQDEIIVNRLDLISYSEVVTGVAHINGATATPGGNQ